MKDRGVSQYKLRTKCGIDSRTLRKLKSNENIETNTLDKLCAILDCKMEDIAEFVPSYLYKK